MEVPFTTSAGKVRDRFSLDGWAALQDIAKTVRQLAATATPGDDGARAMSVLLRKSAGFAGLVRENMYRSAGWRFLAFGRALERADRALEPLDGGDGANEQALRDEFAGYFEAVA